MKKTIDMLLMLMLMLEDALDAEAAEADVAVPMSMFMVTGCVRKMEGFVGV